MTNEEFIATILPYAKQSQTKHRVFASVTISQGCFESGYGRYEGAVVQIDHNLFGIKFDGNHDPDLNITQGSVVGDGAGHYCHYDNIGDSCIDHGYFLKNNIRYTEAGVFTATDGKTQLQRIMNAGYAEQAYYEQACLIIDQYNLTQYDVLEPDENAEKVENAVQWLINIANDNTHGYDQGNRWSPDYDCSSFVISGYEQAGVPLKTNGATYTGDLKDVALHSGFTEVDWQNDVSKLVRGDIILNELHHVCCYIGNGQIVQASINELGTSMGGQTGDQTGKEIYVRNFYVYSHGWDCVLRFGNGTTGGGTGGTGGTGGVPSDDKFGDDYFSVYESYFNEYGDLSEVYKKIKNTPYILNQLEPEFILFLRTLNINDSVHMKFTFDHNKRQVGKNYLGNKLTFDNKEYKIKDVRNNGLIVLDFSGSVCYNYINPKFIYQTETEKAETKNINVQKIKAHIQEEIEQAAIYEEQ